MLTSVSLKSSRSRSGSRRPPPAAGCAAAAPKPLRLASKALGRRSVACVANGRSTWLLARVVRGLWSFRGLPLRPLVAPPQVKVAAWSDHRGYWEQGYPAVMLTNTAVLRNPNYHEPTDTPDTLNYNAMAMFSSQLLKAVRRL